MVIVDTDVCPLYGEVYEKKYQHRSLLRRTTSKLIFGEDAIG